MECTYYVAESVAALQTEMEVKVYGLMRIAQSFAPILAANGGGALVQLNSVPSMKSFSSFATYSPSKAAAHAITWRVRPSEIIPRTARTRGWHRDGSGCWGARRYLYCR